MQVWTDREYTGANLAGVDLKTVDLNEVRIDFAQAAAFARSYGAVIE